MFTRGSEPCYYGAMTEQHRDEAGRYIRYEVADRVASVTVDRPEYRNAQSRVLLEELDEAFMAAAQDPQVNVICLFGAGDHFSAGHDLGTPEELADQTERPWEPGIRGWYDRTWEQFYANTKRWREIPKPTVAAVQGYCIFGGWMIASGMDVIFSANNAMFLGSHFQYFCMPWDLHPRKVKELLFESRFIDANEAQHLGLVNHTTPVSDLNEYTLDWARRVAQNDPFQLRMMKTAINHAEETQGFTAHTQAAHSMYVLARMGEKDPGSYIEQSDAKRRPMVEVALENHRRRNR